MARITGATPSVAKTSSRAPPNSGSDPTSHIAAASRLYTRKMHVRTSCRSTIRRPISLPIDSLRGLCARFGTWLQHTQQFLLSVGLVYTVQCYEKFFDWILAGTPRAIAGGAEAPLSYIIHSARSGTYA